MAVTRCFIPGDSRDDNFCAAGPAKNGVGLDRADSQAEVALRQQPVDKYGRNTLGAARDLHQCIRVIEGVVDNRILLPNARPTELINLFIRQAAMCPQRDENRNLGAGSIAFNSIQQNRKNTVRLHWTSQITYKNADIFLPCT